MKRLLLAIVAGLTVFGLVFGAAASLSVNPDQLASGSSLTVSGCDTSVDVSFGLEAGNIANVAELTVSGIDTTCNGETMHVELVHAGGTVTATPTPVSGASHTVSLLSTVAAADVTQVNVTITG